ncbi:hypothetical protein GNP61_19610 [Aliivibrio fischeri]|nr:hypothetical protein [Aliivibrio fischeri]
MVERLKSISFSKKDMRILENSTPYKLPEVIGTTISGKKISLTALGSSNLDFGSYDEKIATVKSGEITPIKQGTVLIKALYKEKTPQKVNAFVASLEVHVLRRRYFPPVYPGP